MRRLCLVCLSDWVEIPEDICLACEIDRDRRMKILGQTGSMRRNDSAVDWWGPTQKDINPEDIAFGFHVEGGYSA